MRFIERYETIVSRYKDRTACDDNVQKLTYGELDERACKVYAKLKTLGIGKEDFVVVFLKRGVDTLAAILGILKCGAAFVPLEDTYPQERVNYSKRHK